MESGPGNMRMASPLPDRSTTGAVGDPNGTISQSQSKANILGGGRMVSGATSATNNVGGGRMVSGATSATNNVGGGGWIRKFEELTFTLFRFILERPPATGEAKGPCLYCGPSRSPEYASCIAQQINALLSEIQKIETQLDENRVAAVIPFLANLMFMKQQDFRRVNTMELLKIVDEFQKSTEDNNYRSLNIDMQLKNLIEFADSVRKFSEFLLKSADPVKQQEALCEAKTAAQQNAMLQLQGQNQGQGQQSQQQMQQQYNNQNQNNGGMVGGNVPNAYQQQQYNQTQNNPSTISGNFPPLNNANNGYQQQQQSQQQQYNMMNNTNMGMMGQQQNPPNGYQNTNMNNTMMTGQYQQSMNPNDANKVIGNPPQAVVPPPMYSWEMPPPAGGCQMQMQPNAASGGCQMPQSKKNKTSKKTLNTTNKNKPCNCAGGNGGNEKGLDEPGSNSNAVIAKASKCKPKKKPPKPTKPLCGRNLQCPYQAQQGQQQNSSCYPPEPGNDDKWSPLSIQGAALNVNDLFPSVHQFNNIRELKIPGAQPFDQPMRCPFDPPPVTRACPTAPAWMQKSSLGRGNRVCKWKDCPLPMRRQPQIMACSIGFGNPNPIRKSAGSPSPQPQPPPPTSTMELPPEEPPGPPGPPPTAPCDIVKDIFNTVNATPENLSRLASVPEFGPDFVSLVQRVITVVRKNCGDTGVFHARRSKEFEDREALLKSKISMMQEQMSKMVIPKPEVPPPPPPEMNDVATETDNMEPPEPFNVQVGPEMSSTGVQVDREEIVKETMPHISETPQPLTDLIKKEDAEGTTECRCTCKCLETCTATKQSKSSPALYNFDNEV